MEIPDKELKRLYEQGQISLEAVFEILSHKGCAPQLLYDDNGHWSCTPVGFCQVPQGRDPEDLTLTHVVTADNWHETIREAVLSLLTDEEE